MPRRSAGAGQGAAARSISSVSVAPQTETRRILALTTISRAIAGLGRCVDIGVADALEMAEHGHPRLRLDPLRPATAAARDDQVDAAAEPATAGRRPRRGPRSARSGRSRAGRPASSSPAHDRPADREAGGERVAAAAQDQRIARAQADGGGVGGDIGPAFEDHRRSRRSACAPGRNRARWAASSAPSPRRADREAPRSARPRRRSPRAWPRRAEADRPAASQRPRRAHWRRGFRLPGRGAARPWRGSPRSASPRGARRSISAAARALRPISHHRASITRSSRWIKRVRAAIAEQFLDPAARMAGDRARLFRIIGADPARELAPVGIEDREADAALERARRPRRCRPGAGSCRRPAPCAAPASTARLPAGFSVPAIHCL